MVEAVEIQERRARRQEAEHAECSTSVSDGAGSSKRPTRPARILYVSPNACLFGAERVLLNMLAALDRSRIDPLVLVPEEGELSTAVREIGVPVFVSRDAYPLRSASFWRASAGARRLTRLLKKHRVDIVHLNLWSPYSDISVVASAVWWSGASWVIHVQNNMKYSTSYLEPFERYCFTQADRAICMTRFVERTLREHSPSKRWSLQSVRSCVIPGGFVVARATSGSDSTEALRRSLGIAPDAPIAGVVAALSPIKNQELFLRAAALVRQRFPQAHFLVVGSPYNPQETEYVDQLKRVQAELELDSAVQFLGYRRDVPDLMRVMDVMVLPSRTEAFGGVLVEAMAAGTPVVAAHIDGIPEVVRDGETGFLIAGESPERYAEAMVRLLSDRELARRFGERGRVWAAERFDAASVARQVEAVYAGLCRRGRWERARLVATAATLRGLARWL